MKIENPFESGHIKNYILLYASIIVIMILFFIASTLFNDVAKVEKKTFDTQVVTAKKSEVKTQNKQEKEKKFKLMDKAY